MCPPGISAVPTPATTDNEGTWTSAHQHINSMQQRTSVFVTENQPFCVITGLCSASYVRSKTWSCSHLLLCALLLQRRPCSNDRYLLPTGPTAENPPHAAAAGQWDRQTDRRQRRRKNIWTDTVPLHRRCSAHNTGNTNKQMPACHEINSLQNVRSLHFHDYA